LNVRIKDCQRASIRKNADENGKNLLYNTIRIIDPSSSHSFPFNSSGAETPLFLFVHSFGGSAGVIGLPPAMMGISEIIGGDADTLQRRPFIGG
jgi:hypothetical protein